MKCDENRMKRFISFFSFLAILSISIFNMVAFANAQNIAYGAISSINNDGAVTISAGFNAGFEIGDILVVQRQGIKVGLAHVDQVNPADSVAMIIKIQPGMDVMVGDNVAYQLLDAASTEINVTAGFQTPPDIIKHKWVNQQASATNYDQIINNQKAILSEKPHDRMAMLRLADAYFKKGWYKHSIQWNQRSIDEQPKSDDNDKVLFQIIRAYGYLNEPEKQKLYIDFLSKNYPESVFVGIKTKEALQRQEKLQPEWKKYSGPIEDSMGFRKGGMNFIQKGTPQAEATDTPNIIPIEKLLLHGKPGLMEPSTSEPNY